MSAYYQGFADGLTAYAHWEDGSQRVGTSGKRLSEALKNIPATHNYNPPDPAADLEDMTIAELVQVIEDARRIAKEKQADMKAEGGCCCHISPPCSFCVEGGSAEIP